MSESRSRSKRPGEKTLTRWPLDSTLYSEALKSGLLIVDEEGNLRTVGVFPLDLATNPIRPRMPCVIEDPITPTDIATVRALGGIYAGDRGLIVNSVPYVFNWIAPGAYETIRTPVIYRTAQCNTAAATTVWNPAANMHFRLMGGVITFGGVAQAAAAQTTITFLDEAAAIALAFNAYIPAAAADVARPPIGFDLRPNGYLSVAADNNLNVTLTANLTAGNICVTVWGTEE